jgi:bacterioferritin-associated ferredoxin
MSQASAVYSRDDLTFIELHLDIDSKNDTIQHLYLKGPLKSQYEDVLESLKQLVLGRSIQESLKHLKANASAHVAEIESLTDLGLWLYTKAIEDYYGREQALESRSDLLCLCYGLSKADLRREILKREDYDLPQLIAETKASSACGSCRLIIKQQFVELREKLGVVKGFAAEVRTHLDKEGHWIKIKNYYPAELLIKLDDLKQNWLIREKVNESFSFELIQLEGFHVDIKVSSLTGEVISSERAAGLLKALGDYWQSELGVRFFLHLSI